MTPQDSASASSTPRTTARRRTRVATDASVKNHRRGAGVAFVSRDGRVGAVYTTTPADVVLAELAAVELALDELRNRPLVIECDSKHAVGYLLGSSTPRISTHVTTTARIRAKLKRSNSEVRWVRGHAGYELNELADRASRAARRQHEYEFPDSWLRQILDRLREEVGQLAASVA